MAENKTKPTKLSVAAFIDALTDQTKRADAKALAKLMQSVTGEKPIMDGPHIFGFSPVTLCINLASALASARLVWSVSASINAATLNLVGLVLFSAIHPAFRLFPA